MRMRPLVQHGVADALDGKPELDAAFVLQLAPSSQQSFTVWGFWPPAGNSYDKPLVVTGVATGDQVIPFIHAAVLQNSYVYFVSDDGMGKIILGRAKMWTTHKDAKGQPALSFDKIEFGPPLSGSSSAVRYTYPSLEVTYDGKAVVTFHSISTGILTAISVKIAVFDKSLNLVSPPKEVIVGDFLTSFVGTFDPDYVTSSLDPLLPWQVWFTAVSSGPSGTQFSIGPFDRS